LSRTHPFRTAQQTLQARQQNWQLEWLGEIVIRSGGESFQDILRSASGSEHQNWDEISAGAEFGGYRETVFAGEHYVEDYGVEVLFSVEQRS
jgi:hypothetical protein